MSFYFILDITALFSILIDVIDIQWGLETIIYGDSGSTTGEDANIAQTATIARAGKASRIGTRTARIIRIIRLTRLVRVVKLQKEAVKLSAGLEGIKKSKKLKKANQKSAALNEDWVQDKELSEGDEEMASESKVGKKLSNETTKKIVIMTLAIIIIIPFADSSMQIDSQNSTTYGLDQFQQLYKASATPELEINNAFEAQKQYHASIQNYQELALLYVNFNTSKLTYTKLFQDGNTVENPASDEVKNILNDKILTRQRKSDYTNLSPGETLELFKQGNDCYVANNTSESKCHIEAVIVKRSDNVWDSSFNIIKTLIVCLVLVLSSVYFNNNASSMIITPIEKMNEKMVKISKNPLMAIKEEENEKLMLHKMKEEQKEMLIDSDEMDTEEGKLLETKMLEDTLFKISSLLILGYGEAGTEIIGQNISQGGVLNPVIEGKKVQAIYGFCYILNFNEATEALQEDVMLLVNNIGELVHSMVDTNLGSPNKNIGEAFLIVWKFPESEVLKDQRSSELKLANSETVRQITDLSLVSFMKIIAKLHRSYDILKWRQNSKLLNHFGREFKVQMCFGLHVGWGIEGAIGSEWKIDASQLSPNVNVSSRLCAATQQYGVNLLFSDSFYALLSPEVKKECRVVDKVTVKGSNEPITLFTSDINTSNFTMDISSNVEVDSDFKYNLKLKKKMERDALWEKAIAGENIASNLFLTDSDLLILRSSVQQDFVDKQTEGQHEQIKGNWDKSKELLEQAEQIKAKMDGPVQNLLHYMAEFDYQKPDDWEGYRKLTEK